MVAPPDDLVQASEEGITIHNGCMVSRVLEKDGQVTGGVEYLRDIGLLLSTRRVRSGWKLPEVQKKVLAADQVILAAGVKPELDFIDRRRHCAQPQRDAEDRSPNPGDFDRTGSLPPATSPPDLPSWPTPSVRDARPPWQYTGF